jgi:mono/diheme cytochrome c family protein
MSLPCALAVTPEPSPWHGRLAHVARRYSGTTWAGCPCHPWGPKIVHACLISAWVLVLTGCKFKPEHNMEEQPKYFPPFKPSDVFVDGTSARPVPAGAVPRLPADSPGTPYADLRDTLPADTVAGTEASAIPFPVTAEVLERGQQRFNIYCSVCHGRLGNGEGMIPRRGLTPPPSFHIDRLRQVSDGHFYNVITNGYGAMFSYNDRVKPEDRWMIVAYIRALQSATRDVATLTDEDRKKLQGVRP